MYLSDLIEISQSLIRENKQDFEVCFQDDEGNLLKISYLDIARDADDQKTNIVVIG